MTCEHDFSRKVSDNCYAVMTKPPATSVCSKCGLSRGMFEYLNPPCNDPPAEADNQEEDRALEREEDHYALEEDDLGDDRDLY